MKDADLKKIIAYLDVHEIENFKTANFKGSNFDECDLALFSFENSNFSDVSFKKSQLTGCQFNHATFENANLYKSEISFSDFSFVNLSKCNFKDANLYQTNFFFSNFVEANFTNTNASNTQFINCNLQKANFESANLSESDLSNSNLSYANLSNANLKNTNLTGTNLTGANLSGVKICETDKIIAQIIGEENFKKAIIIPYIEPIYKSLNFTFISNNYIEYSHNNSNKTNHICQHSIIKFETIVYRDKHRHYLSIETLIPKINSLKEKINISANQLFIVEEQNNEIKFGSCSEDALGNSQPVYEVVVIISESKEIINCILYLADSETYFEFT